MPRTVAFREALNEAMAEEMERDDRVFLMGEEVGHYHGAYKVSQGMLERVRREARHRHADRRVRLRRRRRSARRWSGLRPIIEFMTWNFSLVAIDQIVNNAAKIRQMSGGQFNAADRVPRPGRLGAQLGAQHTQSTRGAATRTSRASRS